MKVPLNRRSSRIPPSSTTHDSARLRATVRGLRPTTTAAFIVGAMIVVTHAVHASMAGGDSNGPAVPGALFIAQTTTGTADGTRRFYDSINPNLVGAFAGAGIGVLGGLIGAIGGALAPRGKAKGLVVGLFGLMIAVGLALIALGVGALVAKAPWNVAYGLLLPGALGAVLGSLLLPVVLARYREAELRRLEAETFRAG